MRMRWPITSILAGRGAILFSVAVLVLFAYAAYEMNTGFGSRARLFGNVIIVPALALAMAQLLREVRRASPRAVPPEAAFTRSAMTWGVAFLVSLWAFGLVVTIPLFAFVYLRLAAGEAWPKAALYAVASLVVVMFLFDRLLHVPLPGGAIPLPAFAN